MPPVTYDPYTGLQTTRRPTNPLVAAFQTIWSAMRGTASRAFNLPGRPAAVGDAMRDSYLTSVRWDRKGIIEGLKRLGAIDPRISSMLEETASDATIRGFKIVMKNNAVTGDAVEQRAFQIVDRLRHRLKMEMESEDWAKRMIRDGDLFGQVLLDAETGEVAGLAILDASVTHPCKDNRGRWKEGPEKAYYQTDGSTDLPVQWFAEWEIVHVKWGGGEGDLYGQPQFRAAIKSGHYLEKLEEDLAIRRRVRTGLKFHHQVRGTWEDVEDYKRNNRETLDRPYDVKTDFFSTDACVITPLPGDPGVGDLGDIELHITNQYVRGRVPKALHGYEAGISGDLLALQMEKYLRYLERIDERLEVFIRGIFSRALLFAGINDEGIEYEIVWGPKTEDSLDMRIARAHTLRMDGVISMETYLALASVPGVDWETEKEKIKAEMEDFPVPPMSLASGRPALPMSVAELQALYPWVFGMQPENQAPNTVANRGNNRTAQERDSSGDAAAQEGGKGIFRRNGGSNGKG